MKNSTHGTVAPCVVNNMNRGPYALKARAIGPYALKARAILAWGNAPGSMPTRPSGLKARARIALLRLDQRRLLVRFGNL